MKFTPYNELTETQRAAVEARYQTNGDTHEYAFSEAGALITRRSTGKPKAPAAPTPATAPTPAAAASYRCPHCQGDFSEKPKGFGPHVRHCAKRSTASPAALPVAAVVELVQESAAAAGVTPAEFARTFNSAGPLAQMPIESHPQFEELRTKYGWDPSTRTFASTLSGVSTFHPVVTVDAAPAAGPLVSVPLVCMDESPTNPRTKHDPAKHEELCDSMRAHGWLPVWPALLRAKPGPGVVVISTEPGNPECDRYTLAHPETNAPLFGSRTWPQAEAEALASTKYARRFEVVFAHRRTRAARAIGTIDEAPAVIRELSDVEALELQLIENVQREGLSPIEEAEHLRRLLSLRTAKGEPVHTLATISRRVGLSIEHVRRSLLLCHLEGEAREAVASNKLGASIGYELGRIPDGEARARAAHEILNPTHGEAPMRYQAALDHIRREFTRNLREARFEVEDAELVPERRRIDPNAAEQTVRYFGGSCVDCLFNSVNANGPKPSKANKVGVCGNVACFEAKTTADFDRWHAQHNKPEEGKLALTAERNAEVFDDAGAINWRSGLVALSEEPDAGLLDEEKVSAAGATVGTWKELTKGRLGEVQVARHPSTGKKVEVIDVNAAKAAAELNGHTFFKTSKAPRFANTAKGDEEHKQATLDTKRQQEINSRTEARIYADCAQRAAALGYLPPGGFRWLADWILGVTAPKAVEKVERRRKIESGGLGDLLHAATDAEALALGVELVLADFYAAGCDEGAENGLTLFGVSLANVAGEVAAAVDAELAPKTPLPLDPNLPHGEGWHARKFDLWPSPEAYEWTPEGVATAPDVIEVQLPGAKKHALTVTLSAAFYVVDSVPGWFAGHECAGDGWGTSSPVKVEPAGFISRFGALADAARRCLARLESEERVPEKTRAKMRQIVETMQDCGTAEEESEKSAATESAPTGTPRGNSAPTPTHIAYVTALDVACGGEVDVLVQDFSDSAWQEATASPDVVWACPIAGVKTTQEARSAAREAFAAGAGEVTAAGVKIGFYAGEQKEAA